MARSALTPAWETFSVAGAFAAFSEDQLLRLFRARPDLASPPPDDLSAVATRAASWGSIDACLSTLNRPSQQVLDALCLLPQPVPIAELVALLGGQVEAGALDATLERLVDLALLFRLGDELRVHPQVGARPNPAGLGAPAIKLLTSQQVSRLQTISKHLKLEPKRTKAETLTALVAALADPTVVKRALIGAPEGTYDLVALLGEHPVGSVSTGTYYIKSNTPLGWLADRGLVVVTDWETVAMPREVGLALRDGRPFPDFSLTPPAIRWHPAEPASVDRASTEQALRVVADIATILDSWQDGPPKLLKAGGIGVRDIRRAATAVGRTEVDGARLIELAAVAGLAGWDEVTGAALPRLDYDDWLNRDVAERWLVLVTAWLDTQLHVALAGATGTNGKPIPPLLDRWPERGADARRRLVLAALLEGEPDQAADPDALAARVIWESPSIWTGGPARPPTLISWVRDEAEMLGVSAFGALSSLGRAVVAGREEEAVAHLAAHAPRLTSQFVVQADLTAVAAGPLAPAVRAEIELMADLESSGGATVFRFSEQSLRRAYDAGRTSEELIGFLEQHAAKGVPQPLTYLVEDVSRRHGRVRVGSASCYVRSDDPSLLAEILAGRRVAKLGLRQLAPTVLVSTATPDAVIASLRGGGYLPAAEDGGGGLVLVRSKALRASGGHGFSDEGLFDADPGEPPNDQHEVRAVGDVLAAIKQPFAKPRSPQPPDLESLVRRLRSPRPSSVDGSKPPRPPAQPVNGARGTIGSPPAGAPISQLDLLADQYGRPREIARSFSDILEFLELSLDLDWGLRLEYTNQLGQCQQLNAVVYRVHRRQAYVNMLPDLATRKLDISRIVWARVMTEAEEEIL